ncbi:polynucleotide adenylyltransferase PcnB [Candidatus Methylopumilus planktonicus]|uniref:polynucleotide adenylyltransferase PcnB n=1 Tax=Candidatus Methylopumilus planktonicus TaxID=1581557 RepID=UPI003BEF3806
MSSTPPILKAFFKKFKKTNFEIDFKKIDISLISVHAIKTIEVLEDNGFEAYLVGGAVRDLLFGIKPKDFDVVTNATPDQIHHLFRRSRMIGRRFKLVHVIYGREVIEVSTYRSQQKEIPQPDGSMIRDDNHYGTIEEDAMRRDFTINAMFYSPTNHKLVDFHEGLEDLKHGIIRMIGDPEKRYQEDPIRILRAFRVCAKLNMTLHNPSRSPIKKIIPLLHDIPHSRLFDEVIKFFLTGHALNSYKVMQDESIYSQFFLSPTFKSEEMNLFISNGLKNTDLRINQDKSCNPSFLFSFLLWHQVHLLWNQYKVELKHSIAGLNQAIDEVIEKQIKLFPIHKRFTITMKEIWRLQPRFENQSPKKIYRLLLHPRFRAAYDFMLLRCQSNQLDQSIGIWWTSFIDADHHEKSLMVKQLTRK